VFEQFPDHRRNAVGGSRRANGLQIAPGTERAAFALDYDHADIVVRFDFRAELFEFLAIERSIELKAPGRLSVMVAIGPSILSSAGSSGMEEVA
jgi:hypothetical protein